jgi:hypothetical protein
LERGEEKVEKITLRKVTQRHLVVCNENFIFEKTFHIHIMVYDWIVNTHYDL